jgi:hypothetical protein
MVSFIAGLGGREVTVPDVKTMVDRVESAARGEAQLATQWIGLRE